MKRKLKNILVTGGAGFIGSNFINYLFKNKFFEGKIVNIDKITYAGNLENLRDVEQRFGGERYFFEKVDINYFDKIKAIFNHYEIDTVVHFAAESHVDRSVHGPKEFLHTNVMGTFNLLEVARKCWIGKEKKKKLFHHISTDEVYGSIEEGGYFYEDSPCQPNNP
jgi:dTDP-glucose 4,6-dehydratase